MNPVAYESVEPCFDLRPFVRRFIVSRGGGLVNTAMHPVPAGCNYLAWVYGGALSISSNQGVPRKFRGLTCFGQVVKHELNINVLGRVPHILVEFKPTGLYRLTGVSAATIQGQAAEMERLSPRLHARLTDCLNTMLIDMEGHVGALEQALLTLVDDARPEMDYLRHAADEIELADGRIKVSLLSNEVGISQRQLTHKYKDIVGVGPKFHSKVLRAYAALSHLTSGDMESLSEIAQTCGYYDQAHFVRAMQEIFRLSPRRVLSKSPQYILQFAGLSPDEMV